MALHYRRYGQTCNSSEPDVEHSLFDRWHTRSVTRVLDSALLCSALGPTSTLPVAGLVGREVIKLVPREHEGGNFEGRLKIPCKIREMTLPARNEIILT